MIFSGGLNIDLLENGDAAICCRFRLDLVSINYPDEWVYDSEFELRFGDHIYYSVLVRRNGVPYKMDDFFFGVALFHGRLLLI